MGDLLFHLSVLTVNNLNNCIILTSNHMWLISNIIGDTYRLNSYFKLYYFENKQPDYLFLE